MGTTYAPQALWYSWMADLTSHDLQLRAITTGFMVSDNMTSIYIFLDPNFSFGQNSFDFAFVTWWPLIFYPVTDAPHYRKGYIASLVVGTLTIPIIILIAWLERRGRRNGTLGRLKDYGPPATPDLNDSRSRPGSSAHSQSQDGHDDTRDETRPLLST